ncbi:MAG: nucleotidyltransferase domain-containing protein [Thermodesulfobacteriota bacterium]|nr:nucleotidyltransferase domain-containing protein [Thermodesulfobacteriota bacterium]
MDNRIQLIRKITNYINSIDSVLFAYIFGSFARGEAFSDIDIGIYMKDVIEEATMDIEFEMEDKVEKIIGYPVDVRVLNMAPVSFVFQVIRDGMLIRDDDPDDRSDFEGLIFKKVNDFAVFRNEYLREIADAPI